MSEAHEKLIGSIGCGSRIEITDPTTPAAWCSHDGPHCHWCQVKRDVCDELTKAFGDTAILDTLEQECSSSFRQDLRDICEREGFEIKCRT